VTNGWASNSLTRDLEFQYRLITALSSSVRL
jgi:hypothetical protein